MVDIDRRSLFKLAGMTTLTALGNDTSGAPAWSPPERDDKETISCLVDLTRCIGCRKCEQACNASNGLPQPDVPFDHESVFTETRRPEASAFTVVNRTEGPPSPDQAFREHTFTKVQCMHCLEPACASACIVGALQRQPNGAVTYDAGKCIGCRYCLVACPFQIPAYEFDTALTPRVRKCTYCFDQLTSQGDPPACASACPVEAIVFGKRGELLEVARERIKYRPDRYIDHVYGENEVGGTAWLYLAGREFPGVGLLELPGEVVPRLAESIQHVTFKHFIPPIILYGLLATTAWLTRRGERLGTSPDGEVNASLQQEEGSE